MKIIKYFLGFAFIILAITINAQSIQTKNRTLIVFFDGLRPDYITPELMPNVFEFKKNGGYGNQHHSVYPTVTRVNASSYSTGSYPSTHGLLGNSVYFPKVDPIKGINTGDAEEMDKLIKATGGKLLTAITLGEVLKSAGAKMMVFSSGSTGQALMQNHTISGGATINPALILPAGFKETVIKDIGPLPVHSKPNVKQHSWVTEALIHYGLIENGPLVSAIWYSDPDGSAHSDGIGSLAAVESIRSVDREFGRILETLKQNDLVSIYNIIISTDHGFVTHIGKQSLQDLLIKKGLKKDSTSDDVVVVGGAVYVKDHDKQQIKNIVKALQTEDWVGAIFTKGRRGEMKGFVDGSLSFESIHWDHSERTADILIDVNWNDEENNKGFKGKSFSRGVAGHGSLSPYEVSIPLIVSGPDFKPNYENDLPTSNVDIAPTILHLLNLPVPASMDGRVLHEMLIEKKIALPAPKVKKEIIETETIVNGVKYILTLYRSILGKYKYVDFAKTRREGTKYEIRSTK